MKNPTPVWDQISLEQLEADLDDVLVKHHGEEALYELAEERGDFIFGIDVRESRRAEATKYRVGIDYASEPDRTVYVRHRGAKK